MDLSQGHEPEGLKKLCIDLSKIFGPRVYNYQEGFIHHSSNNGGLFGLKTLRLSSLGLGPYMGGLFGLKICLFELYMLFLKAIKWDE